MQQYPHAQTHLPSWMYAYIQNRVARRAAWISAETTMQYEISKSPQLRAAEERYTTGKLQKKDVLAAIGEDETEKLKAVKKQGGEK